MHNIANQHLGILQYITTRWLQTPVFKKKEIGLTSHFPCCVLFFKWIFQCSELTSAQCGMVKAKGVVTIMSGGPQVTSGLRRTSHPSDWRLYNWERRKERNMKRSRYIESQSKSRTFQDSLHSGSWFGLNHLSWRISPGTESRFKVMLSQARWQMLEPAR